MKHCLYFYFFLIGLLGCNENPAPGKQVLVSNNIKNKVIDTYWLYLPKEHSNKKKWPIILFLQGQDAISSNPATSKEAGPVLYCNTKLSEYINQFIIINPHMKIGKIEERQWSQYAETLIEILKKVSSEYDGDSSRYYLTGLSLGGPGTWGIAKKFPNFFAAIVPIAGALSCNSNCDKLVHQNMWVIHNKNDNNISYEYSSDAVKHLEENYGIRFLRMETTDLTTDEAFKASYLFSAPQTYGHDAWSDAYNSPSLYKWLLCKRVNHKL